MERVHIIRNISSMSNDITKELDSLADRAYQLAQQAAKLEKAAKATFSEKGVQTADTGCGMPDLKLDRARRLAAFAFQPFAPRNINWKKIRSMSIERLIAETDTRSLMELFADVAHADLEAESGYNLTEANLVKLLQLCQLMLQFQQWRMEQSAHETQLLQEERSALMAAMRLIPDMSLSDVEKDLAHLGSEYAKVADADLDAMFIQVRTEERTEAADVMAGTADQAKKELAVRTQAAAALQVGPLPLAQQPGGAGQLPSKLQPQQGAGGVSFQGAAPAAGGHPGVPAAGAAAAGALQAAAQGHQNPAAVVGALTSARLATNPNANLFPPDAATSLTEYVRNKKQQQQGDAGKGGKSAAVTARQSQRLSQLGFTNFTPLQPKGLDQASSTFEEKQAELRRASKAQPAPLPPASFRPGLAVSDPFQMAAAVASSTGGPVVGYGWAGLPEQLQQSQQVQAGMQASMQTQQLQAGMPAASGYPTANIPQQPQLQPGGAGTGVVNATSSGTSGAGAPAPGELTLRPGPAASWQHPPPPPPTAIPQQR